MNKTHSYIVFLLFSLSMLFSAVSTANRTYGPVKNNDYLSKIVNKSYPNSALTRDQLMIGILRANYDSFRGGNVHFLKVGEQLILPDENVVSQIDKDEATRVVKEHLVFFKRGNPGSFPEIPLPTVVVAEPTEKTVDKKVDAGDEDTTQPEVNSATATQEDAESAKDSLAPIQESVVNAEKEIEGSRTKLESLETEKTQQDQVLQSLEMQIKRLEDELQSTASDTVKNDDNTRSSEVDVEKEDSELSSGVPSDESSLEDSTIKALENNTSAGAENEGAVKDTKEVSDTEQVQQTEVAPTLPAVEAPINTPAKENVFVEEEKKEEVLPKSVAKEPAETPESESSLSDINVPWWVWLIPLILVPLLILGLIFKSKDRVSSTDLPQVKQPKKKSPVKEVPHVSASEPVIKTSSTVVESDDTYEESLSSSATTNGAESASEKEVSLKIDMARAYLDMDYHDAAVEILKEVVEEGNAVQVERAREILARI